MHDLLAHADPVKAFWLADTRGEVIGLRTSGTTARPRIVVRSTLSWTSSFDTYSRLTNIDDQSRVWIPGSSQGTMNLFALVHASWCGARLVDQASEATHICLTPAALRSSLDAQLVHPGCTAIVAGDALSTGVRDRAVEQGIVVCHYYGASELSFVAWGSGVDDLEAFPGVEVEVRDELLWCRSPYLAQGYAVGGGALHFASDGFATVGDRGRICDGVIEVMGRGGEAVTTSGSTVLVADVEAELRPLAHGEVVVIGVPHEQWGAVLAAVVTDPRDRVELPERAHAILPPSHRPRRWVLVDSLPVTNAGKVDRTALAALDFGTAGGPSGQMAR